MRAEQPQVEAIGGHDYVIRARQGDELVEIQVYASPAVVARISTGNTDEIQIIQATADYLIRRQRADDLPATLDLEDVAAAYDGYVEDIAVQVRTH